MWNIDINGGGRGSNQTVLARGRLSPRAVQALRLMCNR
jgi:hypothetical protein